MSTDKTNQSSVQVENVWSVLVDDAEQAERFRRYSEEYRCTKPANTTFSAFVSQREEAFRLSKEKP